MSTSGISAKGTALVVSGTTIAHVYSISGPSASKEGPEITDLSDNWRFFSGSGMRDAGEITLGLRYIPADTSHDGAQGLVKGFSTDSVQACVLTWPDASTFTFSGIMTGIDISADLDSALDASVTFKVTGIPAWS